MRCRTAAASARQSQLQAQAAQLELRRIQAAQAQREAQERAQPERAQQVRAEMAQQRIRQQQEAASVAAQRQALLAGAGPAPGALLVSPTPCFKGYAEYQRQYSLGDEFNIRVIDQFNKAVKPLQMKVTQVDLDAERVVCNDGGFVSDLMGNTTTNQRGSFNTLRQFYPADLIAGKKWRTRFKQSRPQGVTYTFEYDLKVVGREPVTVPAGTFDAFKIKARGINIELGARLERTIWVALGVNADIAHEMVVRLSNGRLQQNDRQELVSFVQARH